jgi:hypothetical protein
MATPGLPARRGSFENRHGQLGSSLGRIWFWLLASADGYVRSTWLGLLGPFQGAPGQGPGRTSRDRIRLSTTSTSAVGSPCSTTRASDPEGQRQHVRRADTCSHFGRDSSGNRSIRRKHQQTNKRCVRRQEKGPHAWTNAICNPVAVELGSFVCNLGRQSEQPLAVPMVPDGQGDFKQTEPENRTNERGKEWCCSFLSIGLRCTVAQFHTRDGGQCQTDDASSRAGSNSFLRSRTT